MTQPTPASDEADRLHAMLDANSVNPLILESRFEEFSPQAKDALVSRLAQQTQPLPPGKVLARLPFILTAANKSHMQSVFRNNLRSPFPDARTSSLYGLQQLEAPDLHECAEQALVDENDDVLVAACSVLLPQAQHDARLHARLRGLYAAHRDRPQYYGCNALLNANGIN